MSEYHIIYAMGKYTVVVACFSGNVYDIVSQSLAPHCCGHHSARGRDHTTRQKRIVRNRSNANTLALLHAVRFSSGSRVNCGWR